MAITGCLAQESRAASRARRVCEHVHGRVCTSTGRGAVAQPLGRRAMTALGLGLGLAALLAWVAAIRTPGEMGMGIGMGWNERGQARRPGCLGPVVQYAQLSHSLSPLPRSPCMGCICNLALLIALV